MPRVKRGVKGARRRKAVLKKASGYRGGRSKLMRTASEAVDKGEQYAYAHRKTKKREYRQLWNTRIGAAAKENGTSYSRFIASLKSAGVELDRKILADLAVYHPKDFSAIVSEVNKPAA
jgi:large subunit ribosomal protein L20